MNTDKLIKAIILPRYRIELHEVNHEYVIRYVNNSYQGDHYSESIKDLNMASYLFDMKLEELEGQ